MNEVSNILMPIVDKYYNLSDLDVQKNIEVTMSELKSNKNFNSNDLSKSKDVIKDFLQKQKPMSSNVNNKNATPTSTNGKCALLVVPLALVFVIVVVWEFAVGGTTPALRSMNTEGLFKDKLVNSIALSL